MMFNRVFDFRPISVPLNMEGAKLLLSHLAKPTNPRAPANKLENWLRMADPNSTPTNRRSRRQVESGILDVWEGLRTAVEIGDRYDRALVFHEGSWRNDPNLSEIARPVNAGDVTQWKNYLPLAHTAAAFRAVLFERRQGQAFSNLRKDSERLEIIWHLLVLDQSWIAAVLEKAHARFVLPHLYANFQWQAKIWHFIPVAKRALVAAND